MQSEKSGLDTACSIIQGKNTNSLGKIAFADLFSNNKVSEDQRVIWKFQEPTQWKTSALFSLHIRSMWETICDAWACWSGWKFGANSTEYPYSVIQNTPPPPKIEIKPDLGTLSIFNYRIPPPPKIEI